MSSNIELLQLANILNIPNFRGIFMRDTLPNKIHQNESGIININSSDKNDSGH